MKRILTIALCGAMLLSLCACKENPDKPEPEKEPVIITDNTDGTDAPVENVEPPKIAELNEVETLAEFLREKDIYKNHYQTEYKSGIFEHEVKEYWVYELTDGNSAYLRLYDSSETAEKEASNYQDGNASHYTAYNDGELVTSTIIDYAVPVWLWRYEAAVIELGGGENGDICAKLFAEKFGDYFASTDPTVTVAPVEKGENAPEEKPSESDGSGAAYDVSTQNFEPVDLSQILPDSDDVVAAVAGEQCEYYVVELADTDIQPLDKLALEPPTLICELSELESYRNTHKEALDADSCNEALDGFDGEYFKKSSLLLVPLMAGNLEPDFRLNEIKLNKTNIILEIDETDGMEDAIDFRLMIVGLKNVKFDKKYTKIKANRTVIPLAKNPADSLPPADGNPDTTGTELDYKWEAIRTNGDGYPRQTVITDRAALDEYYEHCSAGWSRTDEIKAKFDGYTDEWFASNSLIIVAVEYGSGSTRTFVDGVTQSGNDICVTLRAETPEVSTCDMAGWQILIETQKLTGSEMVTVAGARGVIDTNLATE